MTSNEILKADPLDILFDNRNKQYGAYTLRKKYNQRLGLALGISLSTLLFFFVLIPKNQSAIVFDTPDHDSVVLRTVKIPDEVKKIIPLPQVKPVVQTFRQQQFTTMVITQDDKVKVTVADQNQLLTNLISNQTIGGDIPTGVVSLIKDPTPAPAEEAPKKADVDIVQKEPEFPGGQEAWLKFLQRNLVAPSELEPGEKKTVFIRFVVAADGTVTGFEIIQSSGKVFDNEVIRVLKKMPKWKPAIQNGQPVPRFFTQPVTFMGVEG
jgi:protein TonB